MATVMAWTMAGRWVKVAAASVAVVGAVGVVGFGLGEPGLAGVGRDIERGGSVGELEVEAVGGEGVGTEKVLVELGDEEAEIGAVRLVECDAVGEQGEGFRDVPGCAAVEGILGSEVVGRELDEVVVTEGAGAAHTDGDGTGLDVALLVRGAGELQRTAEAMPG
jgi:hypothetical protein